MVQGGRMQLMTTTDDDLRALLRQTDMTPEQIDALFAQPESVAFAKLTLDRIHEIVAERLAQRIVSALFPEAR